MTKQKKNLPKVYHADLYGLREDKYEFLKEKSISTIEWTEIPPVEPNYFFVEKDFEVQEEYHKGFIIPELFTTNNVGIVTSRDSFVIDDNLQKLEERIKDFFILKKDDIQNKYSLKENKSWKIDEVKNKAQKYNKESIQRISYRPFDIKYIYYNDDFIERSRKEVMQHFLKGENVGLLTVRQSAIDRWEHVGITKLITDDSRVSNRTRERGYVFPLYLYPDDNEQQSMDEKQGRKPNLNMEIVKEIEEKLGMKFVPEKEPRTIKERTPPNEEGTPPNLPKGEALRGNSPSSGEIQDTSGLKSPSSGGVGEVSSGVGEVSSFAPIDILDYIYAVLHSPTYREKYKEFLKIDFPRVPYPYDTEIFWKLVELGGELRQIHLLESPKVTQFITSYPNDGDNVITRSLTKKSPGFELTDAENKTGRVWINDQQYFDGVPEVAYNFYIGGYQPAQKWLKDRKKRKLSFEDIMHYQKIIVALTETDRIMKRIDEIEVDGIV